MSKEIILQKYVNYIRNNLFKDSFNFEQFLNTFFYLNGEKNFEFFYDVFGELQSKEQFIFYIKIRNFYIKPEDFVSFVISTKIGHHIVEIVNSGKLTEKLQDEIMLYFHGREKDV